MRNRGWSRKIALAAAFALGCSAHATVLAQANEAPPQGAEVASVMKPFGGISSKEDRAKIIGFLRAQGGG